MGSDPSAPKLRAGALWRVTSLSPFILEVAVRLLAPTFSEPMFSKPPDILGIPLGLALKVFAWIWAAIGVVLTWRTTSSRVAVLAIWVFTLPSFIALVFGPALILILQNLG